MDITDGPCHAVPVLSTPRSPLSGIPVRTAPAAAVSPIQVLKTSAFIQKSHVGFGGGELVLDFFFCLFKKKFFLETFLH